MKQGFFNLSNDYLFKKVFSDKDQLKQILKVLFLKDIKRFEYKDKEMIKENKELSYGIHDLLVENEEEIIMIEMQNRKIGSLAKRSMIYISDQYRNQWKKRESN